MQLYVIGVVTVCWDSALLQLSYGKYSYLVGKGIVGNGPSKMVSNGLKGPSQPPPFLMPSKLLILQCETKSYYFAVHVGCVHESIFTYL